MRSESLQTFYLKKRGKRVLHILEQSATSGVLARLMEKVQPIEQEWK